MSPPDLTDELDMVREHINHEHADTVAFVARHLPLHAVPLARAGVAAAEISRLDADGAEFDISLVDGAVRSLRHGFSNRCTSLDEIRSEFLAMVEHARNVVGDGEPLTTLEAELSGSGAIATFLTEVVEVEMFQPNLRRIRFGGGLERFESIGGDQFMFVLLPPVGSNELTVGTDFTWEQNNARPESERATGAYYSVRSFEPGPGGQGANSIDMWFVLHDHGRATEWAANTHPGDRVALWGPRRTFEPPPETDSYLLVTDESGFGATVALLEELSLDPRHLPITVVAEAGQPALAIDLPLPLNASVEWVFRDSNPTADSSLLLDAVEAVSVGESAYAYGAGESHQISAIRRYLRQDLGLPADQVSMIAYWRATSA